MTKAQKILLFGGSFSPPTLAHEEIIARCLALPRFDEVWVMPSADRLDKQMAIDGPTRLQMLKAIHTTRFAATPRLKISDFELQLPPPTNTYQTLAALHAAFSGTTFWLAFGMDAYRSMPTWPHGQTLQKNLQVVLFGSSPPPPESNRFPYIQLGAAFADLSSTKVRLALQAGRPIDTMVSGPVADCLKKLV